MKKSTSNSIHVLNCPLQVYNYLNSADKNLKSSLVRETEEQQLRRFRIHLNKVIELAHRDLEKVLSYTQYLHDVKPTAQFHIGSRTVYFDGLSEMRWMNAARSSQLSATLKLSSNSFHWGR